MPIDYSDDQTLVDALRRRDEAAFVWLLDQYDGSLRRVALSFVPTAAVADEVVQETWLGVVRGISTFEGRSSVKTWIFRILMNIGRTKGEHERRTVPFATGVEDDAPSFAPDRFRTAPTPYPRHWARPPEPWDEQPADVLLGRDARSRSPGHRRAATEPAGRDAAPRHGWVDIERGV